MSFMMLENKVNRTISPRDSLYPVYAARHGPNEYIRSGLRHLDTIQRLLATHAATRLEKCGSILDFACHYGRLLRSLRAALPDQALYACDIDVAAVEFCAREFACIPLVTDWNPEHAKVAVQHDLVICLSLITHTRLSYLRQVLGLWQRMLRPGGILLFTYLGDAYIDEWLAGRLDHYGKVTEAARTSAVQQFRRNGHAFCGYRTAYSETDDYGIGFIGTDFMSDEVGKYPYLRLLDTSSGFFNGFGQDLAVIRRSSSL